MHSHSRDDALYDFILNNAKLWEDHPTMSSEDHPFDPKATESESLLPKELVIDVVSVRCRDDPNDVEMLSPQSKNAPETLTGEGPPTSMDTSSVPEEPKAKKGETDDEPASYKFDTSGRLVNVKNGEKFVFTTQKNYEAIGDWVTGQVYKKMTQPPYNLEKVLLQDLYYKNGQLCGDRLYDEDMYSFVFSTPQDQKFKHLVVLIHGSGVVRAGQWTRKLIINEGLDVGSQLPYIRECQKRGWGVIVMNTNDIVCYCYPPKSQSSSQGEGEPETSEGEPAQKKAHKSMESDEGYEEAAKCSPEKPDSMAESEMMQDVPNPGSSRNAPEIGLKNAADIPDVFVPNAKVEEPSPICMKKKAKINSSGPEGHGLYVWQKLVQPKCFNDHELKIAIVAHSYGGIVTMEILRDMAYKIKRIDEDAESNECMQALDALKALKSICLTDAIFDEQVASWMKPRAPKIRNWVTSALPLDTKLPKRSSTAFSAGTDEHERTSSAAMSSVFKFIEESFSED